MLCFQGSSERQGEPTHRPPAGVDDAANHIVGLVISDSDERAARRVFVGHDKQGSARVALMDRSGRPRIVMQVAADGAPTLSFLDAEGKVQNEIGPLEHR